MTVKKNGDGTITVNFHTIYFVVGTVVAILAILGAGRMYVRSVVEEMAASKVWVDCRIEELAPTKTSTVIIQEQLSQIRIDINSMKIDIAQDIKDIKDSLKEIQK